MPLTKPYSPSTPSKMRTSRGEIDVPAQVNFDEFAKLDWNETDRWELIEGVPCMSPSGLLEHQALIAEIFSFIKTALSARNFLVVTDLDIAFPLLNSYLRPDVSVFEQGRWPTFGVVPVRERPVLCVEILPRSTAANDLGTKPEIYARGGVGEYWVADPVSGALMIFVRSSEGEYSQQGVGADGKVHSPLIGKNLQIKRDGLLYQIVHA